MSEELLARDAAIVAEPQQHEDWTSTEGGFLRFYGAPPAPTSALWGGVNANRTERPWTMRATADVGDPSEKTGLPHWPALVIAGVILIGLSRWHG